jgi:hypothetical protein
MKTNSYTAQKIWAYGVIIICTTSIINISSAMAQTTTYDGIYAGLQTLSENAPDNYSKCLHGPFKRKLIINNGTVKYTYNPTYQGQVTGSVDADGDVTADESTSNGGIKLSGKIQGDDFTGEIWGSFCTYSLQLKRAGR